jgi:SAM-dependent methyltransferase
MNLKAEIVKRIRRFSDSSHDSYEICTVCGSNTKFSYNSWAIDQTLLRGWEGATIGAAYLYRESMFCAVCHSSYRVRRLAKELINAFSPECVSLEQLVKQPVFASLKILEVNEIGSFGSFHSILKKHPLVTTTRFIPGGPFGIYRNGASIQDLESLTFEDSSFDLILHSDVLEHIPRIEFAINEMYRVLKPGGRCVFTVPVNLNISKTFTRAEFLSTGKRIDLHKPLFHGRGGGPFRILPVRDDYLEITSFGADAASVLSANNITLTTLTDSNAKFGIGEDLVFLAMR